MIYMLVYVCVYVFYVDGCFAWMYVYEPMCAWNWSSLCYGLQ